MSDWKKHDEQPADTSADDMPTPDDTPTPEDTAAPVRSARRGQRRAAAVLGFITMLMAVFGVVSLVIFAVLGINRYREETLDEVAYFISPLTAFCPDAFSDVNDTDQDALLLSAIYRVTTAEQIRQARENAAECLYPLDDLGRMLVPVSEIEDAYHALYGADANIYHHTIGEEGLSYTYSYDKDAGIYHIPQDAGNSMYNLVHDKLGGLFGTVTVEVGYVPGMLPIDERGETIQPTLADAQINQKFTLKKSGDSYRIVSVTDLKRQ